MHGIAVLSLIVAFVCLPRVKVTSKGKENEPAFAENTGDTADSGKAKTRLNKSSWSWAGITFLLFIGVQAYTVYISYVLNEKSIGGAAESGATVAVAYIGGFIYGIAMAICMPAVFVNTANSVDAFSSAMALSITMCAQNLGQFVCPYIMNFIAGMIGSLHPSTLVYLLAGVLLACMGVPAAVWGMKKGRIST